MDDLNEDVLDIREKQSSTTTTLGRLEASFENQTKQFTKELGGINQNILTMNVTVDGELTNLKTELAKKAGSSDLVEATGEISGTAGLCITRVLLECKANR